MEGDGFNLNAPACSACRHQRKRCYAQCQLARYFPAAKYEDFQNVHRIFGVNNLQRILTTAPAHLKDKTAETLILEARMRKKYPVHGSLTVQAHLQAQINGYQKELELVKKHLSFCEETKKLLQRKEQPECCLVESSPLELLSQSSSLPFPPLAQEFGTSSHSALLQPPGEAIFVSDTNIHGYNYRTTWEECAEIKPLHLQPLDELIDYFRQEHALTNFGEPGLSSARSKARGKKPIVCDSDEEMEDKEASSKQK